MKKIDFAGHLGCFVLRDAVFYSLEFKKKYEKFEFAAIDFKIRLNELKALETFKKMHDEIKIYHGHCIMCSILGVLNPEKKSDISMKRKYFRNIEKKIALMAEEIKPHLSQHNTEKFNTYKCCLKEFDDYIKNNSEEYIKDFLDKCYKYYR